MDNEFSSASDSVYSNKVRAGKRRTYFFDVRQTKGSDYYVTLTESTRRFNGEGYSRHKIFLYKEDFNRFVEGLQDAIDHIKNDLLPEFDYEQFDRRNDEYNESLDAEDARDSINTEKDPKISKDTDSIENEDDLNW